MHRFLALILLAGTAAPALAAGDPGDSDRQSRREARQQAREEARAERSNSGNDQQGSSRVTRSTRSGGDDGPQPTVRVDSGGSDGGGERRASRARFSGGEQPAAQVETSGGGNAGERSFNRSLRGRFGGGEQPAIQPVARDSDSSATPERRLRERVRGPRIVEAPQGTVEDRAAPALRQSERPLPRVLRNRVPVVSSTPREGTQPPLRTENRRTNWASWSTSRWRSDHRYNWREHRRRHRSLFRLGFYFDPFGWNYRPYQIGWRLWPSYYSSRYWIHDPWQYRLPYAPPGYRWIRYHDDAILVDTWSGQVVDVIHNFFW